MPDERWDQLIAAEDERAVGIFELLESAGWADLTLAAIPEQLEGMGLKDVAAASAYFLGRWCGTPDQPGARAGIGLKSIAFGGEPWSLRRLTWKVDRAGCNLDQATLDASTIGVFRDWKVALPWLTFEHAPSAANTDVQILIRFAEMKPATVGSTDYPNHATPVVATLNTVTSLAGVIGPVKMTWTANFFEFILRHELGHAFGLGHTADVGSVMYPNTSAGNVIDPQLMAWARSLYGWGDVSRLGVTAGGRPALASNGTTAVALWRGYDDQTLCYSVSRGSVFNGGTRMAGRGSSHPPAIAFTSQGWLAMWKGINDDPQIYTSMLARADGAWTTQEQVGWRTPSSPSIVELGTALLAAWRDEMDDGINWAWKGQLGDILSPAGRWTEPERIPDMRSSGGPTLVAAGGSLHAFAQGSDGDTRVWHSDLDLARRSWAPSAVISPVSAVEVVTPMGGPPTVAVTRADLHSIHGVSACALADGSIALAAGLPRDGVTFSVLGPGGRWDWTDPFHTGFESFGGQAVTVVQDRLVVVGAASGDRFEQALAQQALALR